MKTSFKKSVAVFMVALMLLSALSVSVFAATTYSITYKPGNYGKETEEYVDGGYAKNEQVDPRGETYTRTGYTQTGWSTNAKGSTNNYRFDKQIKITKNLTLYPYWTANEYTVTFSGGEFGEGTSEEEKVKFDKTVLAPDAIFTREGYIQIGWTATVIEITEDADGNEVFTPVVDEIGLGERIAAVTGDVTYVPVWQQVIIDVDVEMDGLNFGSLCEDYEAPSAGTITITNEGNVTLNYTLPESEDYNVTLVSGNLALAPGATLTISVQPKVGLAIAQHDATLEFVCDQAKGSFTAEVSFGVVAHSFDKYVSNGDATYDEDGTKTAYCTNGCGAPDVQIDVGSKKVFSADNNAAIGLLPEYVYHKTVRFTAFGSGMDNENPVEGSKRYLPVSWWVNDEHNGEFTEATGYDVNFVHTDFGNFVLVINYVEQEMNADGEWVDTGVEDEKVFNYTIGASEKDQQEVVMPNTIVSIIFGLFTYFFEIIGSLFG